MFIAGMYSHNGGIEAIKGKYSYLLDEIYEVFNKFNSSSAINSENCKYDLTKYQETLKDDFKKHGWEFNEQIIPVDFTKYYSKKFLDKHGEKIIKQIKPTVQVSLVKEKLGLNIEFQRHHLVCHNLNSQLTIFRKLGIIDYAIEIAPTMLFSKCFNFDYDILSFEHYIAQLTYRGTADTDFPLVIIGIEE